MIETELQKYYEDRFSMMVTVGWKDFIEDVQDLFDQYNNISTVDDEKSLQKRKGQLDILNWILTLKDVSNETYTELQNEETI
jgi:hypothetical protein|tara:strand:+ start:3861 stop:4106 length:246 start_codon:yes stop_codon:yes gene_type:complete